MSAAPDRSGLLKSSAGVALATLLSRVLGLGRVMLESRVLGGGAVAGAWLFALAIPNLFRRLLGEGALGTALIPLLTHTEAQRGADQVRRDLGVVFCCLGLVLAAIVVVISLVAWGLRELSGWEVGWRYFPLLATERVRLTLYLVPLLMPYAFFICLIGVVGAVLNARKVFFLPALGALLLNLALIGGLGFGYWRGIRGAALTGMLPVLAGLVLLSGAVQLVLLLGLLWRTGRFPQFRWAELRELRVVRELWQLVLPGLIGGSALQISFVVDRMLALSLGPQAVPALGYVDRLVDLPIGIFAVSLGSVLMVELSHRAAAADREGMLESLVFSLRHVYFICVPMTLTVVVFREPLLRLLLMGGNFNRSDLEAALPVAVCYGLGIPSFCSLKMILPMFHARKMMTLPMKVSLLCIAVNLALNLILMRFLAQAGIALATVLSSMLNNGILIWCLRREGLVLPGRRLALTLLRFVILSGVAVTVAYAAFRRWGGGPGAGYLEQWVAFLLALALLAGIYLLLGRWSGSPELGEAMALVRRRRVRK